MKRYFVCEPGPMGGIEIIFIGHDRQSAEQFAKTRAASYHKDSNPLSIFEETAEVEPKTAIVHKV